MGQVDHAMTPERATVIDADHHGLAVFKVGHTDPSAKWERPMRSSQRVRAKHITAGGASPIEPGPIPTGGPTNTGLHRWGIRGNAQHNIAGLLDLELLGGRTGQCNVSTQPKKQ